MLVTVCGQSVVVTWRSSVCPFERVRADIGPILQDLPGYLLDVGIIVLRRVWNKFETELKNKPV